MVAFAERFVHILTVGAHELLKTTPPVRKARNKIDPRFVENDLRKFLQSAVLGGRIPLPKDWPTFKIESNGRIDYLFVDGTSILASCEVKGPVIRKSFFDPKKFGSNWTSDKFLKDVRNQSRRATAGGEHYLGLIFPWSEVQLESKALGSSLAEVLQRIEAANPGTRLKQIASKEIALPSGSPLTTVVVQAT